MWGQIIGSIAGGLLGKGKSPGKTTNDNIRNMAAGSRKWGEAYGFNPLSLLGVSGAAVAQGGASGGIAMGQSVADAAMQIAQGLFAKPSDNPEAEQLAQANQRLERKVQTLTLQPNVPGVYERGSDRTAADPMPAVSLSSRPVQTTYVDPNEIVVGNPTDENVGKAYQPIPGGYGFDNWYPLPGAADAEAVTTRDGEGGENVNTFLTLPRKAGLNLRIAAEQNLFGWEHHVGQDGNIYRKRAAGFSGADDGYVISVPKSRDKVKGQPKPIKQNLRY